MSKLSKKELLQIIIDKNWDKRRAKVAAQRELNKKNNKKWKEGLSNKKYNIYPNSQVDHGPSKPPSS
jgi:hypothetical protein